MENFLRTRVMTGDADRLTIMNALHSRRAGARRRPLVRITHSGYVTFDGLVIGALESARDVDGHLQWGYRPVAVTASRQDLVLVQGSQWAAARACAAAYLWSRSRPERQLRHRAAA